MNSDPSTETSKRWVWCAECGPRAGLEFHNPDKVHCSDCGRVLGEAIQSVETDMAAFSPWYRTVIHAETGETLSGVAWKPARVEIHEGHE